MRARAGRGRRGFFMMMPKAASARNSTVSIRNTSAKLITIACWRTRPIISFSAIELRIGALEARREMRDSVSTAVPLVAFTASCRRARCRSMRLLSTVLMAARPMAPPRLRIRLNRPEAFFMRSGASVPSAVLVTGTIDNIRPTPRKICGHRISQKSQSCVT